MNAIRCERLAGLYWLLTVPAAAFAFGYVRGSLVVPGDAAQTAARIAADPLLYRQGIAAIWVLNLLMLLFAVTLYASLRERHAILSRLFLLAIGMSITVSMTMSAVQAGAVLVRGDDLSSLLGSTAPPLSALFARLANSVLAVAELLSAPAYAAFGIIILETRCAPRLIGIALIGMGLGFTLNSFEKLLAPEFHPALFTQTAMALGALGGLPTMAWLIVKGLRPVTSPEAAQRKA
jgi:hypothetical protein